jgi:hypothetical protein
MATVSAFTAALAVAGFWIGSTIHGTVLAAAVPTVAGAAGGFGIGCGLLDIWRRARRSTLPTRTKTRSTRKSPGSNGRARTPMP